jgi:hypothetical protein
VSELFEESRLEDPAALAAADPILRSLAGTGSRVRQEAAVAAAGLSAAGALDRPRAVLAAGADARLLRAVLEPWCPAPFVAWPAAGLPGWAGALDLVVVLAPDGGDEDTAATVTEAARRGTSLLVCAPPASELAEVIATVSPRSGVLLPSDTGDVLAGAVVMLQALHSLGLGPEVLAEDVAAAADAVAEACSPHRDLTRNPGKELALVLADALPLFWGGSVLAARAARRGIEAVRAATGRAGLAADARHLLPVLEAVVERDVFADPFADPGAADRHPALIVLDDGSQAPAVRIARGRLTAAAERRGVRTHVLTHAEGPEMARYAGLLMEGSYAATYLALGLGRFAADPPSG